MKNILILRNSLHRNGFLRGLERGLAYKEIAASDSFRNTLFDCNSGIYEKLHIAHTGTEALNKLHSR